MKIVLIKWEDSNVTHGWILKDTNNNNVAHCQTVGILQAEDENKVTIAMGESDCGSVLEKITIPKGCIKSIRQLRVR